LPGKEPTFSIEMEMAGLPLDITEVKRNNLMLIAVKSGHYHTSVNPPIEQPTATGYLYLDESNQKLYYSSMKYDRPTFLCDWVSALAGGDTCELWQPTITKEGDVIFLKRRSRANPVIYPASDYNNPKVIDVDSTGKDMPYGVLSTTNSINHQYHKDYFCFGEYDTHSINRNGQPFYIWKVSKPYDDPNNWRIVADDWIYWHYQDVGGSGTPEKEISHWHTCEYDYFSGDWVATTGDKDLNCRVIVSEDDGETWVEKASGHQKYRSTGVVFLRDGAWYGTDSSHHYLYHAKRTENGKLDWQNLIQVKRLDFISGAEGSQRTYDTCYVREPEGLLFLCRGEPRWDGKLDLPFYSFETKKLYNLGVYRVIEGEGDDGRYGWGNMCCTQYQSLYENGIICGSNSQERRIKMDVLNNSIENRIGNIKMKVVRN